MEKKILRSFDNLYILIFPSLHVHFAPELTFYAASIQDSI